MIYLDWNAIYLTCFGVGLVLSLVGFFSGFLHLHLGRFHLGGHAGHGTHATHSASTHSSAAAAAPVNGFTVVAFLCWFGGTGYLLHRGNIFTAAVVLLFSAISGLAGSSLVFWFLARVLMAHERTLEPADTELTGVVGRVIGAVSSRGVGEIVYSQNGARRSIAARSDDGSPLERGTEAIVMRYDRGIAFVRRWSDFEQGLLGDGQGQSQQTGTREPARPE